MKIARALHIINSKIKAQISPHVTLITIYHDVVGKCAFYHTILKVFAKGVSEQ